MNALDVRGNIKFEYSNITMVRGDTMMFNVQIMDEDDNAVEVDTATFTCKKRATDGVNIFQKTLNAGITQEDALLIVRVAPEDTADVDEGQYYYDFNIGIGDDVFTILIGTLSIEHDVK